MRPHPSALALGIYAAFALAVTWPVALHPTVLVPGGPESDLWKHLWGHTWTARSILQDHSLPLDVGGLLNHPQGGALFNVDLLNGLLMIPLANLPHPPAPPRGAGSLGHALGFNLLVWGHLVGGAMAMYALARRFVARWAPATLAGLIYAFSPFILACPVASGVSERLNVAWIPLFLLLFLRILDGVRLWDLGLLAVVVFALACGSWNYALLVCVLALLFSAWLLALPLGRQFLARRMPDAALAREYLDLLVLKLLPVAVISGLAVLPVYLAAGSSSQGAGALSTSFHSGVFWDGRALPNYGSIPLKYSFLPLQAGLKTLFSQDRILTTTYLGGTVLALAFLSLFSKRRHVRFFLGMAPVLVLLSQGPTVSWTEEGARFGSPLYLAFIRVVPFAHALNIVEQYAFLATFCLALCAAVGLDWLLDQTPARGRPWLASLLPALVGAELVFLSPIPIPVPTSRIHVPAFYETLNDAADSQGVFDFPGRRGGCARRPTDTDLSVYLFYQTVHGRGVPYAINRGTSWIDRDPFWRQSLEDRCSLSAGADAGSSDATLRQARDTLARNGYGWFVLHPEWVPEDERAPLRRTFTRMFGPPSHEDAEVVAWTLTVK